MTMLDRRDFLTTAGLGAASLALARCGQSSARKKPHIIFIMADDMGWGDVSAYNPESRIQTPNIDRLASQGLRFTDAHSPSAVCTPTRYGVLTGRYCWRTWLSRGVVGGYTPPLIEPTRPTVATFLKSHGYTTGCFGKWHLGLGWTRSNGFTPTWEDTEKMRGGSWQDGDPEKGLNVDFTKPVQGGPTDLGFDTAFFTAACSTIDGPFTYIRDDRVTALPDRMIDVESYPPGDYRPRPGWVAPGFELENVDVEFTREAISFMEESVTEDPDRPILLYLALSSPHAPWLPPDMVKGATSEGPRGDLVYLADWCLGEVMNALERLGIAGDTLLFMTSDNGPRHGTEGHDAAGSWRGHKSHIWEGGHRIPFIARWPGMIEPGTVSDELICLTDLMATCAGIVGADLPEEAGPDSYDLSSVLLGRRGAGPVREALVSHSENGTFAIRQGRWKLILDNKTSGGWVRPSGRRPEPGTPGQLYNLESDPGEQNDLWEARPDVVERLTGLLERYRSEGRSAP